MAISPETLYYLSDNIIEVTGVLNVATGGYINDADVSLTLVDGSSRDEIANQTWPLELVYVPESNGVYRGTINDTIDVSDHQSLIAQVTVDGGAGLRRYWEKHCIVKVGD